MKDREMLEAAAKAAGIDIHWNAMVNAGKHPIVNYRNAYEYDEWNPLERDGDALRLAVKLGMTIEYTRTLAGVYAGMNCWPSGRGDCAATEQSADPNADVRRAIVRAAAALGRANDDQ